MLSSSLAFYRGRRWFLDVVLWTRGRPQWVLWNTHTASVALGALFLFSASLSSVEPVELGRREPGSHTGAGAGALGEGRSAPLGVKQLRGEMEEETLGFAVGDQKSVAPKQSMSMTTSHASAPVFGRMTQNHQ